MIMRILITITFYLSIISCSNKAVIKNNDFVNAFDSILVNHDLTGTILVYDPQEKTFYSNDFQKAEKGYLPASTFKIPNSIIALETNVMGSDTTVIKWDGKKRDFKDWERDLTLREAFQASCVPCYQEIALKIGTERMTSYLQKLNYNNMVVNNSTLDHFWLRGDSQISPYEQIFFFRKTI